MKISVVIPVYNVEKYLSECLDSIFSQTMREIEVVCVNDGSTDRSLEILHDYQARHDNMVVITQQNAGSGRARNVGIDAARGKYLMFVDPDDLLAADDVLEALYKAAENNHVEVCGGSFVIKKNNAFIKEFPKRIKKSRVDVEGMRNFLDYQYAFAHQRYLIQKELLVKNRIYYPEYRRGQDVPFMTNVLITVKHFYLIKKDIYVHRQMHKEEKFTEKKANDFISAFYDVSALAIENNLEELYETAISEILTFAKRHWYKILKDNDSWDKIVQVNELIKKGNSVFQNDKDINYLMGKDAYENYLKEMGKEWEYAEQRIQEHDAFAIYGAGKGAKNVYKYLEKKGYRPFCFVVSSQQGNVKMMEEIPVILIDELENAQKYLFILGALNSDIKMEMKEYLLDKGCNNILDFDCTIVNYL